MEQTSHSTSFSRSQDRSVLVTGCAGFIGYHLSKALLSRGETVFGVDNLNDYYHVGLKQTRLAKLIQSDGFTFDLIDLSDAAATNAYFADHQFAFVFHMAAQPGVRYSLENPQAYVASNLAAFVNVIEGCRQHEHAHFIYASSSSVYGTRIAGLPSKTSDPANRPISLYAATKKANELMAHAYSHLYQFPTTGLRFFTVYGPWGRPDMAVYRFTEAILNHREIDLYNYGRMRRDLTYIDDAVDAVMRVADLPQGTANNDGNGVTSNTAPVPARVYNVGSGRPIRLTELVDLIEDCVGHEAQRRFTLRQPGDVLDTCADLGAESGVADYHPRVSIEEGIAKYVAWHRAYYADCRLRSLTALGS